MKKVIFIFILILSIGNIMFILNLKSSENKNIILNDNSDKILEFLKIIDDVLEYSKKNRINEQELSLFSNYADLKKYLVKANIDIPIYDSMIPQGITIYQNLYLITAYDSLNTLNSVCYVVSKYGKLIKTIDLNMNSHVGSISYDKINNLIWIPDTNGVLRAYNVNNFLNDDYVIPLYTFNNVSDGLINYQNKKENEIAFLTIYDNYIYLGSFGYNTKGLVKKYYINNTKKIKLELVNEFKIPSKVQGLTLFEKDNDLYMLLSRSYGRNRDSYIEVYKYSDDVKDYNKSIKTITLPPMIEQITLENNKLYAIFESNALKYIECENKIDDIIIFDINKILFSEDY